jgi:hypothetical protein
MRAIVKAGICGYSSGIQGAIITGPSDKAEKKAITWHTAFFDAIRLELYPYRDVLSFEFEHSLTSEPLRIDVIIVKKEPGAVIEKPIGAIFKTVNVVEYKSPHDYLSIEDFHKVGAYARLYSALNGTAITDMTVTYVVEAHPYKVLDYVRKVYGYTVSEKWPGIYHVKGDILGIQIIESKRLGEEDAIWLKNLTGGLSGRRLRKILETGEGMPKEAPLSAYMYRVLAANPQEFREVMKMSDLTFEGVLEEFGLTAKWEEKGWEEGREEGQKESVKMLRKHGMTSEQISEVLEIPLDRIQNYLEKEHDSKRDFH